MPTIITQKDNTKEDIMTIDPNSIQSTNRENTLREYRDMLLVDDEADQLLVVGELLRAKGFGVITAQDADEAMRRLDEYKLGMVVLDLNLAGENGLQLMKYMKANHPSVPVLLYTGMSHNEEQVQSMLKAGATCYVNKSQPPAELVFAVQQVLNFH